jgi:hypothetical protein
MSNYPNSVTHPEGPEYDVEPLLSSRILEGLAYVDDLQCYFEKFPDVSGIDDLMDGVLHIRDVLEDFQDHVERLTLFLGG